MPSVPPLYIHQTAKQQHGCQSHARNGACAGSLATLSFNVTAVLSFNVVRHNATNDTHVLAAFSAYATSSSVAEVRVSESRESAQATLAISCPAQTKRGTQHRDTRDSHTPGTQGTLATTTSVGTEEGCRSSRVEESTGIHVLRAVSIGVNWVSPCDRCPKNTSSHLRDRLHDRLQHRRGQSREVDEAGQDLSSALLLTGRQLRAQQLSQNHVRQCRDRELIVEVRRSRWCAKTSAAAMGYLQHSRQHRGDSGTNVSSLYSRRQAHQALSQGGETHPGIRRPHAASTVPQLRPSPLHPAHIHTAVMTHQRHQLWDRKQRPGRTVTALIWLGT